MPVLTENLMCFLGMSLCALSGAADGRSLLTGIFVVFCLGQIVVFEMAYRKLTIKQILSYESVYLMTNFLFALVFRLLVWKSSPTATAGANASFMFFLIFNGAHWLYAIVRLIVKRVIDGPGPKKYVRYGIIQDEEADEGM